MPSSAERLLALLLPALLLAACAGSPKRPGSVPPPSQPDPSVSGPVKIGKPYTVFGKTYVPADDRTYDETGIASWYGPGFHALSTANGERYDQDDITAAHKTLPMPSWVEVTNLDNGRTLTVRINDRGPFVEGRIIDLSRRSAQLLGVDRTGLARVRVRRVFPPQRSGPALAAAPPPPLHDPPVRTVALPPAPAPAVPAAPAGPVFIQVAALADPGRIAWMQAFLGAFGPVVRSPAPGGLTRMRLGPFADAAAAAATLAQLHAAGYPESRIVRP